MTWPMGQMSLPNGNPWAIASSFSLPRMPLRLRYRYGPTFSQTVFREARAVVSSLLRALRQRSWLIDIIPIHHRGCLGPVNKTTHISIDDACASTCRYATFQTTQPTLLGPFTSPEPGAPVSGEARRGETEEGGSLKRLTKALPPDLIFHHRLARVVLFLKTHVRCSAHDHVAWL